MREVLLVSTEAGRCNPTHPLLKHVAPCQLLMNPCASTRARHPSPHAHGRQVGKKKTMDVQFYTEVMDSVQTLEAGRRSA